MKTSIYLFVCIALLSLITSCGGNSDSSEDSTHSPYVVAFTSGQVSRFVPIYLLLNGEIPEEKAAESNLAKQIRIHPEVKGTFSLEQQKTIVFKPEKPLERNTKYTITVDFSDWFDAKGDDQLFTFSLHTYPLALRAEWESLTINPTNEEEYDLDCTFHTPDREEASTVEALVTLSETCKLTWQHSEDGKRHQAKLTNLAGQASPRQLTASVAPNKWEVKEEELMAVEIPATGHFEVVEAKYISEPEKYIEVVFSKLLDPKQPKEGLAYIVGNTSKVVTVDGNRLRLYPDAQRKGAVEVHLSAELRAKNGKRLEADAVHTVEVTPEFPEVRFMNDGMVIPLSNQLTLPFRSIYLRGVRVRVIKVLEQNIGQFLQTNQLDGSIDLSRTGQLVALKTLFLDNDPALDLSQWNTFALDLTRFIRPEPGAIYRVAFTFDKDLSVYPCDSIAPLSKEQILANDALAFKAQTEQFEGGNYYYTDDEQRSWWEYDYRERENPCSASFYYSKSVAKNVMASNLGIIAMAGEENSMTVLVHNLLNTAPERGVTVKAYNFQQQKLAEGTTNEGGQALLNLGTRKPFYLIASQGEQRAYLRVDDGSALSLSAFDVSGEVVQKGVKGFIYGERGVWRPGDTLHLGFMLNDRLKTLPTNHPVTMELVTPVGQLYQRKTVTHGQLGLYTFPLVTEPDAPTGAWQVKVVVGGITFTKRIRIEAIKPNRLKIGLNIPTKVLLRGEGTEAKLHIAWLQGATARNLKYDIQGTFIATPTTFARFPDFCFDNPSRSFGSEESKLIAGTTNAEGEAAVPLRFESGDAAPGMLMANLVTRAYEESGDFSIDGQRILYSPYKQYVGIKSPQKGKEQLNTGSVHNYQVASVDYLGNPKPSTELEVNVYKMDWYWWWSSDKSALANYISDAHAKPMKQFQVKTNQEGKGSFTFTATNDEWGTYLFLVKDRAGRHTTGVMSYYDWPSAEGRRDQEGSQAATQLSFKTDKESYRPGEQLTVTFPSSGGSRAIVTIGNGSRVLSVSGHVCSAGQTTLKLDVTPEMQPNAYLYITLLQPYGTTQNDKPIRLYGVVPFTVNSPESYLHPIIQTPQEVRPESRYTVTVAEQDGREMAYTLAIVDEGLLDLTRFTTPNPWSAFNAREALGIKSWDMYNQIVGAYGGRVGQLFSIGGDDALNRGPKAIVNRFKPVVQFEGPFVLKKGQKRQHTYTMPNYNGRVKVMVVAGNGEAYGQADKPMLVRKPLMLLGTLPRVIGTEEEMVVPATLFATQAGIGEVQVAITCSGNMQVMGESSRLLHVEQVGDQSTQFRIRTLAKSGAGRVTITATAQGERAVYETDIAIRSVARPQTRVVEATVMAGKSWKAPVSMPGAAGTNSLKLEVSDSQPILLSKHIDYLTGYPHGCVEQIVSKAFPQIYLKKMAVLSKEQERETEQVVQEVLRRLRSYQTQEGAFAYWPGRGDANGWATIYALHFMLSAEANGFLVTDAMKRSVLNYLQRTARNWKPAPSPSTASEETTQAYRLFVLSLAKQPEMGAMNRLRENRSLADGSRWLLAAAYAQAGRTDVGQALVAETKPAAAPTSAYDYTFGSAERDKAIRLLTLCLLKKGNKAATVANEIAKSLSSDDWFSTQTTAFCLVALSDYMTQYPPSQGGMNFAYACNGKEGKVQNSGHLWTESLLKGAPQSVPMEITNSGKSTLFVRLITEGVPTQEQVEPHANGLSLSVRYLDAKGHAVEVGNLPQGTHFVAEVTVKNPTASPMNNLVLTNLFPAGWEIMNSRFVHDVATQPTESSYVSYQDIRDDRLHSYIDLLPSGRQVTLKIALSAIYPGHFYLPPVYCEAMYNPLLRANTAAQRVMVR